MLTAQDQKHLRDEIEKSLVAQIETHQGDVLVCTGIDGGREYSTKWRDGKCTIVHERFDDPEADYTPTSETGYTFRVRVELVAVR